MDTSAPNEPSTTAPAVAQVPQPQATAPPCPSGAIAVHFAQVQVRNETGDPTYPVWSIAVAGTVTNRYPAPAAIIGFDIDLTSKKGLHGQASVVMANPPTSIDPGRDAAFGQAQISVSFKSGPFNESVIDEPKSVAAGKTAQGGIINGNPQCGLGGLTLTGT